MSVYPIDSSRCSLKQSLIILGLFKSGILNVLICIAATVVMLYNFRNRHAEKVEDISDSWSGYRTLLPIYALCACGLAK